MKIKSIKLINFLSYKSLFIDNLDNYNFILLAGENGSGKSSIVEAIIFNLYGKSFRGNIGDLCYKENTDTITFGVAIEYKVPNGILRINREYRNLKKDSEGFINRAASPSSLVLEVFLNDQKISFKNAATTQKKIISQYVFPNHDFYIKSHLFKKNILGETDDSIPVTDLIEELFEVKKVDIIAESIKEQKLKFFNSFKEEIDKLNFKSNEIEQLRELKHKERNNIQENINTIQLLTNQHNENINNLIKENKIDENKIKEIEEKIKKINVIIEKNQNIKNEFDNIIYHYDKDIKNAKNLIKENKCFTCKRPFTNEDLNKYKKEIEEKENNILKTKNNLSLIQKEIDKYEEEIKKLQIDSSTIKQKITDRDKEIHYLQNTIIHLKEDIEKLQNTSENNFIVNDEILQKKQKNVLDSFNVLTQLSYIYSLFSIIENEVKEGSPFRYYFIKLDILNNILAFYCDYFNLIFNVQLFFNKKGKIDISIKSKIKNDINFKFTNLSQGQSKRVILILLFSVISYLINNNRHEGLLFFDEILENLDEEGVSAVMQYMKTLSKQQEQSDLQIFFITHSYIQYILNSKLPDKVYVAELNKIDGTSYLIEKNQ